MEAIEDMLPTGNISQAMSRYAMRYVLCAMRTMLCTLFLFILLASCHRSKQNEKPLSTTTSGSVTFWADESFRPLLESTRDVFQHYYHDADIKINYSTERDAITKFMSQESPVVILSRKFSDAELKDYFSKGYNPQQLQLATDAVVFIVNNQNPDSLIAYQRMLEIISGKYSQWGQVNGHNNGAISIIFDKNNSSTATYLIDSILHKQPLPANCYAVDSNAEVMNYVRKNPGAIGVLALNWISDKDDPNVIAALKGLTIIAVSSITDSTKYYKPLEQNLENGYYPFTRPLYLINGEGRSGLGTGFASFIASDKGQIIIRRFELLPANEPNRIIEIKKSF